MQYSFRAGKPVRQFLEAHPKAIRNVGCKGALVSVSIASESDLENILDDLMIVLGSSKYNSDERYAAMRFRNHIAQVRASITQDFYNSAKTIIDTETSQDQDEISHSLPTGSDSISLSSKQLSDETQEVESEINYGTQESSDPEDD